MEKIMEKLTLQKFEEAAEKVKEVTLQTNLVYSEYFSAQSGNKVYLKPENMQYTGAYKVRGAYYKISTMSEEERKKGLITASAGNHAQGVAYAAKKYGVKATVVMPTTTPLIKVNRTKGYGAEVVLYGNVYDEACEYALKLAKEQGLTFVHPFDDLDVATGQGSIAMEIIKELPTVDYILVPIGGGGLATGVSTLAKLLNPNIKVIGVEPAGANCLQESIKAGKVVTLPTVSTIADGTAVKTPGTKLFPYLQKNLDDIITVPDEDLIVAFLDMVENHKMVVENSGLLTVAAVKQLNVKGKKIVSILSGGNMDVITMSSVVQQGLVQRSRIFTVSVLLPDRPGELVRVASIIAEANGNVIKLEHNQFVSINRKATVELRITIEAFGHEHKEEIVEKLEKAGLRPRIVKPWDKGFTVEDMEAYYDEAGFYDYIHKLSRTPILKAQHPDFEIAQMGIHGQRGVSCADCHMPYKSEGGVKFSDHHIQSPLAMIDRTCQTCHRESEETLRNNVYERQRKANEIRNRLEQELAKAHIEAKFAWDKGATEEQMKDVLALIRQAQWRWDFGVASHGGSFHAPQEIQRVLSHGLDRAMQARLAISKVLAKHGYTDNVPMPDISTKDKAQEYIGLDMDAERAAKDNFLKTTAPAWLEKAKANNRLALK